MPEPAYYEALNTRRSDQGIWWDRVLMPREWAARET
jgi:hypothetical protein